MSSTRRLWRWTGLIGLLSTVVLVIGFGYGIHTVLYPKGEKLPEPVVEQPAAAVPKTKDKIQILALGDSLTKGVGDEKAEGYVGKVKKLLEQASDKPVYVWNFAVNGATTADMLAEINKPTAPDYITQADIILFTIGGNDLNRIAAAPASDARTEGERTSASSSVPEEIQFNFKELAAKMPESIERLNQITDRLARLNPAAKIVYLGLYHPYLEFDPTKEAAAWIGKWNESVFQVGSRHPNVTVVPVYDLFQDHWKEYLNSDHFHPNGAGYEEMAARVFQVLK